MLQNSQNSFKSLPVLDFRWWKEKAKLCVICFIAVLETCLRRQNDTQLQKYENSI